jgi:DNA polymerase (family 10)
MRNQDVADLLEKMGTLLEIKDENVFKVKAYYKAAENIRALGEDIEDIKNDGRLGTIPGIGATLQEKIKEFLETGKLHAYQELIKEIPESLLEITQIPTIGPKKAKLFYQELKIKNPQELVKAAQSGALLKLPGIREKTIENILHGIKVVQQGQERMNLGTATETAQTFLLALQTMPEVKQISVAGSLRRGSETVRDIDILIDSANPKKVMDAFVKLPQVRSINAHGETKSSILTDKNIQVDLRVVESRQWGAALLYFTGSKSFNVKLRQIAQKQNMKVNEYGIFKLKGEQEILLASKTEEECFKTLGLTYIPPELREDIGEAEIFAGNKIPSLINQKDLQGDFHVHSTWSDGRNSIAQMAEKARSLGYAYVAISDHSPRLRVAGGVSVEDLPKKKKEIDELNKKYKDFKILFGTEVEIDSEGNLDYNEATLKQFDVVIAAIHSGFEQPKEQLTHRLIKACAHPCVNIIAHPTGVHLGKREPYDIDFKAVCQAAAKHRVFLEINAFPIRLDLNAVNVYFARDLGVKFAINSDAHFVDHMDYIKYGITIARRGWLTKADVLNAFSLDNVLKALRK